MSVYRVRFWVFFWRTDLTRPLAPMIAAADASTEFGFGASVIKAAAPEVQRLAAISEKKCDYIVLDGGIRTGSAARRLGQAHELNLKKDDFVHVFSVRAKRRAHTNILEGEAFIMLLRWVLRKRAYRSTRVVILCDSVVWTGAAAKGRSSTTLNRLLRKSAALQLAGDLMVHIVLAPSDENPSDAPSRGERRQKRKAAPDRSSTKFERHLQNLEQSYAPLRECGVIDSDSSSLQSASFSS